MQIFIKYQRIWPQSRGKNYELDEIVVIKNYFRYLDIFWWFGKFENRFRIEILWMSDKNIDFTKKVSTYYSAEYEWPNFELKSENDRDILR